MAEKTGLTDKPIYDFNTSANLEVYLVGSKRWHRVTCNDFKSWDGERRINGDIYKGPLYAYGTNRLALKEGKNGVVESEVTEARGKISQKIRGSSELLLQDEKPNGEII